MASTRPLVSREAIVAGQRSLRVTCLRDLVEAGLLMGYGTNIQEMFRQIGSIPEVTESDGPAEADTGPKCGRCME